MNDIERKRQWLIGLYPRSPSWTARVKKMPDAQVIAIYLKKQNKQQERAS